MSSSIKIYKGNIFDYVRSEQIDTIINAANGIGPMGRGIAGAIKKYGGIKIQEEAFKVCVNSNPLPGEAYTTKSGNLTKIGVTKIIHAVTMKNPGGKTSYEIIGKAFESALVLSIILKSHVIGCTALGTGVGRLLPDKVAKIMHSIAVKFIEKIDIIFVDLDIKFINRLSELIENDKGSFNGKL